MPPPLPPEGSPSFEPLMNRARYAISSLIKSYNHHKLDGTLRELIETKRADLDRLAHNHRLRSLKPDEIGEAQDIKELSGILKILSSINSKISHPQNKALLDALDRAHTSHDHKTIDALTHVLEKTVLRDRPEILSNHCRDLLSEFETPTRCFEIAYESGETKSYYSTFYRSEDRMLKDYIATKNEEIAEINTYFSGKKGSRSDEEDERACQALLAMRADISEVLTSLRSQAVSEVSWVIDKYQSEGETFQATLILNALHATPLKERANVLANPSLVRNALATNSDGVIYLNGSQKIDYARAPHLYRWITHQKIQEKPAMNELAPEPRLVQSSFLTLERSPIASPTKSKAAGDSEVRAESASDESMSLIDEEEARRHALLHAAVEGMKGSESISYVKEMQGSEWSDEMSTSTSATTSPVEEVDMAEWSDEKRSTITLTSSDRTLQESAEQSMSLSRDFRKQLGDMRSGAGVKEDVAEDSVTISRSH